MTSPSTDKSVSETRNVLNPRIGIKRGFTLPVGDFASERLDVSCEVDVPSGVTIADSITDVNAVCEEFLGEERKKLQQRNPTSPTPSSVARSSTSSPPSTSAAVSDNQTLFREIATRDYRSYKSGKSGEWCMSDELSKPAFELLSKGPVEFEQWKYRLSGPKDDPSRFVARNKVA